MGSYWNEIIPDWYKFIPNWNKFVPPSINRESLSGDPISLDIGPLGGPILRRKGTISDLLGHKAGPNMQTIEFSQEYTI